LKKKPSFFANIKESLSFIVHKYFIGQVSGWHMRSS
jgi:hypothetical protein